MRALEIGDKIKFVDALINNMTMYKFKIDNHEDLTKSYTSDANYDEFEFCYTYGNKIVFFQAHDYHAKAIEIHSSDILDIELVVSNIDNTLDMED